MSTDINIAPSPSTDAAGTEATTFRWTLSAKWTLVLVIVVAVGLRVASALIQGDNVTNLPGIYDQISYDGLAQRVVGGYGFSFAEGHWPVTPGGEPTAHWSYLYTLYLAAVYSVFGVQPVIARLIQAVLAGILHCWLTWRIGKRIFGPRVGLLAAGLSAVYIYFFYYAGALITETFYIIGVLWTFDVALRIAALRREERATRKPMWLWLELGLAIGMTVLLRQLFLLFVPFLFLWLWWNGQEAEGDESTSSRLKRAIRWPTVAGLATATLVVVLLILPWTIRNYRAFGTFVPLNTNAGFAFYWGNHPIHGTHFMPLLSVDGVTYQDLIPDELLQLNEGQLDKELMKRSLAIIAADPRRYILLSISRIPEYFKFWPSADSGTISNISRVASFGLLLPFMLYGLVLSMGRFRKPEYPGQGADIALLIVFMAVYSLIHIMSWTLIRYRLPVDAILIVFAAYGINDLIGRVWNALHKDEQLASASV